MNTAPSIALAKMAYRLAWFRQYSELLPSAAEPVVARPFCSASSANADYYRIIDRITRGERP